MKKIIRIGRQYKILEEISNEVGSGDMSITSYKLIQADALASKRRIFKTGWL